MEYTKKHKDIYKIISDNNGIASNELFTIVPLSSDELSAILEDLENSELIRPSNVSIHKVDIDNPGHLCETKLDFKYYTNPNPPAEEYYKINE